MSKKLEANTSVADFRRRFPTTDELVAYLLVTPPDREITARQLCDEVAHAIAPMDSSESVDE